MGYGFRVIQVVQSNYSVTYRQRLGNNPNSLPNLYFKEQITIVGLSGIIPQIEQLDFNQYSAISPETTNNQLQLSLNRIYITGCISSMPLTVTVNTIAECLRTDCNILGDKLD